MKSTYRTMSGNQLYTLDHSTLAITIETVATGRVRVYNPSDARYRRVMKDFIYWESYTGYYFGSESMEYANIREQA